MTSSSRSSALKFLAVSALLAAVAGCGKSDGTSEYAAAEAAYSAQNLPKAEELFAKSAEFAPTNVDAFVMLAKTRLELGKREEALASARAALELDPDAEDAIELSAQLSWHLRDYEAARAAFERLALDEKREAAVRSRGYAGLGVVDMSVFDDDKSDLSRREKARCEFLTAIALDPKNASARYHLGFLYRDAYGYPEYALDQFSYFKAVAPKVDRHLKNVVDNVIPEIRKRLDSDRAAIPGAASRNGETAAKALQLGDAAFSKGSFKTSRLRYGEALGADPLSFRAAEGVAKSIAKADATADGRRKAYEAYRVACRLGPSKVDIFLKTATLAEQIGRQAAAAELYSRALAASPKSQAAIDGLVRTLAKTGDAKSAGVYRKYGLAVNRKSAAR